MSSVSSSPKLIFIAGTSRSGTTLLDRMLGQLPGFFSTGELRRLWDRGLIKNEPCGCGLRVMECDLWKAVVDQAFGKLTGNQVAEVRRLRRAVERTRNLPGLISPALRNSRFCDDLARHSSGLERLYRAIAEISKSRVIVDSSKAPLHGFVLSTIPNFDIRVIHLVRDSRAVAFSLQRFKARRGSNDRDLLMMRRDPASAAMKWMRVNLLAESLRLTSLQYMRVRYEDLARNPDLVLNRMLLDLDEPDVQPDYMRNRTAQLKRNHTVSGNPMRFLTGSVEVRLDSEWREAMESRHRRIVTALTWPLLITYGYQRA